MSHDLCSALAAVGRRLCSSLVNTESIGAFVACRLMDKCPGVRPIGVGEVPRRIIAKGSRDDGSGGIPAGCLSWRTSRVDCSVGSEFDDPIMSSR